MVSWSLLLISLALFKGPGDAARTPLRRTLSEAASPSGSLSTSEATPTKDQDGKDFQRHQCTGSCELVSRGSNNNTKTSCQCVSPANSNSFVNIEFDHQLRKIYLKCSEEFVIISELESFGLILKNASGYQVTLTKFCCPTNLGGSGNLGRVLGRGLGLTALGGLRVRPRHFQLDLNPGSFRGLQALRIRNLNLQGNITGIAGPNIFLPFKDTLRNLRIENTRTRRLPSDLFAGLENLRALFVIRNHNLLYGAFRGSQFKGLARLEELALRDNNQTHLDQSIFRSMEGLTKLDLGANRFQKLPNDTFDQLTGLAELSILEDCNTQYINAPRCERFFSSRHFQPLKQLKRFSYSAYNHYLCPHFDQNTFEYQNDIHYIRITNACLRSHHLSNFGALPNLKELDVSQNNLTNLGNFEPAHSNIILNLNNNRLDCTCENVNFLIKYGIEPTQQIMPCNMDASFQMDCEQESSLLYVTLASSVAVLAMVLVACFVYTNHRQLQKTKATNSFDDSGEYSAFLSYCNEDKEFAHEIKDSMENNIGSGFKFLYHEEHFGLGRPIIDNIDRAVEVSRCVLLILSQVKITQNSFYANKKYFNTR